MSPKGEGAWGPILLLSGAIALTWEVVWIRRLGLVLGGSAVASSITLGAFMGGLALGSALADRLRTRPARTFAVLEALAAAWGLLLPSLVALVAPEGTLTARWLVAGTLLLPPATAMGASWPVLVRGMPPVEAARLYALNTGGAVLGVLGTTFVLLPTLGVRGTEHAAALAGFGLAGLILTRPDPEPTPPAAVAGPLPPAAVLLAAGACGFAAMGLEVVWMRLAAVALGATVQTLGLVLATFLATVAAGAWWGRHHPADPQRGLVGALTALAALALLGGAAWGWLPYGIAAIYRVGGPEGLLPGSALLAALAMGGAPAASGAAFALAVRSLGPALRERSGALVSANTAGGILGATLGGLWILPGLEARGALALFALTAALAASVVGRRPGPLLLAGVLALVQPAWDAKLYAVGVYLRISDFADPSGAAVRRFADEGWTLLSYDQGLTGAVAVGRSTTTGNTWLSINGKVDASTGDDMPTQLLSGQLPLALVAEPRRVLVVGLASGITAGAVLDDLRVRSLDVVELEPAVVPASRHFDAVSGAPLDDPRTTLILDDARSVLARSGERWDVIVSEPSNPWITGVSNLFTQEYWALARSRLAADGVMVQWVQLYGMGPDELRALVRTFRSVFPDARLFETIPGSDVLLVGGAGALPEVLPVTQTLDPEGVRRLAGSGWLNTDDHPRIEWSAPRWLHYDTAGRNQAIIAEAMLGE